MFDRKSFEETRRLLLATTKVFDGARSPASKAKQKAGSAMRRRIKAWTFEEFQQAEAQTDAQVVLQK